RHADRDDLRAWVPRIDVADGDLHQFTRMPDRDRAAPASALAPHDVHRAVRPHRDDLVARVLGQQVAHRATAQLDARIQRDLGHPGRAALRRRRGEQQEGAGRRLAGARPHSSCTVTALVRYAAGPATIAWKCKPRPRSAGTFGTCMRRAKMPSLGSTGSASTPIVAGSIRSVPRPGIGRCVATGLIASTLTAPGSPATCTCTRAPSVAARQYSG